MTNFEAKNKFPKWKLLRQKYKKYKKCAQNDIV